MRLPYKVRDFSSVQKNFDYLMSKLNLEPLKIIGAAGQPAFQNGWANLDGVRPQAAFWKDAFGIVHVQGTIFNAAGTGIQGPCFTLPAGYTPVDGREHWFDNVSVAGTGFTKFEVQAAGPVNIPVAVAAGTILNLDKIQFRAKMP